MPRFSQLNVGWNADPNSPLPAVTVEADTVVVGFFLNCFLYDCDFEEQSGELRFISCSRWRLGPTNDEGWYRGQCRYSRVAPSWGEFYVLGGDDPSRDQPDDWHAIRPADAGRRHFLFYFRDETFECMADDWSFMKSAPRRSQSDAHSP